MSRVLALHASGASLTEIAEMEHISARQIDNTSLQIRRRLPARNLAQAVLMAHKFGYITLPDENGVVLAQSPFRSEK